jgi:acyl-CoA thioesterase-1
MSLFKSKTFLLLLALTLSPAAAANDTVLVFGDSLSAGYGIDQSDSWVALLQQRLDIQGSPWRVVNASISGETTNGGLARIESTLTRHQPRIVILALGANDGLRGIPIHQISQNLSAMVEQVQAFGADVLLVGMHLPPNYGPVYSQAFHDIFQRVATEYKVPLVPFLLAGLDDKHNDFQPDGLHPVAGRQPHILENIWDRLQPLLQGSSE